MSGATRPFLAVALASLLLAAMLHVQIGRGSAGPGAWHAMIHLMLMGWVSGMILGVFDHVMPVVTGRDFP